MGLRYLYYEENDGIAGIVRGWIDMLEYAALGRDFGRRSGLRAGRGGRDLGDYLRHGAHHLRRGGRHGELAGSANKHPRLKKRFGCQEMASSPRTGAARRVFECKPGVLPTSGDDGQHIVIEHQARGEVPKLQGPGGLATRLGRGAWGGNAGTWQRRIRCSAGAVQEPCDSPRASWSKHSSSPPSLAALDGE